MNWLPLTLFPEGSLASSIVTTVWVGVLVFGFMNLRFGWVFSGLVVPGYIVPLLIVKPWAAAIIVVEAIVTLWTVQALSRLLARSGVACEFFGRDRFLALLMVSAFYRIVADVWLLPLIGEYVTEQFGIAFDYRNNLQSFGLIVIGLAANQLWKTGVLRGSLPFIFNIAVTFLIVRFVLMEFTNFSITNLSYLYEDIATSVYASPKAYIILITTAILASRMNLIYGWDFNGILIPALIALQWYQPIKILTSFVEAILILLIAIQTLRLPIFRSITMEGSRKFLLFFTISFFYKMAIGWTMFYLEPSLKVSDYYGFGYLLPTLMAIKMHQHRKILHQMRITAQVSLVSVLIANVIGFSLTLLPQDSAAIVGLDSKNNLSDIQTYETSKFRQEAYRSYIDLHQAILDPSKNEVMYPETLSLFKTGLEQLCSSNELSIDTRHLLENSGFTIDQFGQEFYRIKPINPASGRPLIYINRKTDSHLTVNCAEALEARFLFEASLNIFEDQQAKVFCSGGNNDFFQKSILQGAVIDVRLANSPGPNSLYVKKSVPQSLELRKLEERFGKLEAHWADSDRENPLRDISQENYCEFHLNPQAKPSPADLREVSEPVDAVFRRVCYDFAPRASNLYTAPSEEELLHLDRHVLTPLFSLTTENISTDYQAISHAASYYGYRVTKLKRAGEIFVILWEPEPQRNWGSVIFRITSDSHLCFQVPSRVRDRSILSFSVTQFRRLNAKALIVAGTNTLTNPDATSKLTVASNRSSFFNLAHQVYCRSQLNSPVVIQCRAYLPPVGQPYPEGDIIAAPYFGNFPAESINAALAPIAEKMETEGIHIESLAYDDATSPYAPGFNVQARYMDFTDKGTFTLYWLSPFFRENYGLQEENPILHKMLKSVSIPIEEKPLTRWVEDYSFAHSAENHHLKESISAFRNNQDIEILESLSRNSNTHFVSVIDPVSSQIFLVATNSADQIILISNLARNAPDRSVSATHGLVQSYIDSRAAWMEKPILSTGI